MMLFGLGYLLMQGQDAKPAVRPGRRETRAAGPAGWPRFLSDAGASPTIARGLERAAALRGLAPSPATAKQLYAYFRTAWQAAKPQLVLLPPPREEDQLYFATLQIAEPGLLKGGRHSDARAVHTDMLHAFKGDERRTKILAAAAHVAFGVPLAVEGVDNTEAPT